MSNQMTLLSRGRRLFLFLAVFLLMFGIISCTDFFSNSLASWATRDPDKLIPAITAGNIDELIAMAENNPDLSLALLKRIQEAEKNASGREKEKLRNAAIQVAVNAAGLGQAVLGVAGKIGSVKNAQDAKDLIIDAINEMQNLEDTSEALRKILPDPADKAEFSKFVENTDPNDLALAAVVILMAEAEIYGGDLGVYMDSLKDRSDDDMINPAERMAIELGGAAIAHQSGISGPLQHVLNGLNLNF